VYDDITLSERKGRGEEGNASRQPGLALFDVREKNQTRKRIASEAGENIFMSIGERRGM